MKVFKVKKDNYCYLNVCCFSEKEKKKKIKDLGEIQAKMKCQMEPSSALPKLECKDWPLLFKVTILK